MAQPKVMTAAQRPRILVAAAAAAVILIAVLSFSLAFTAARGKPQAAATNTPPASTPAESTGDVHIQVEHTLFHPMDNVVLQVERMNGRMVATDAAVISLDDRNSFSIQIDQSVTRLSARDLSALINSYLLRQAGSAIRHLDVSFDGQQVVLKGKVHKLVTLPFQARGTLSATPDGELRMHMGEFRVAGMLSRKFLAFFGIRLDDVAQPRHKASFRVEGDDIITSINELFPPPRIFGRLTRVHVEQQNLVQVIGVQPPEHAIAKIPKALPDPPNYIYFTGGRMRFGRVIMDNVALKLVDDNPATPFDFSLDHYQEQIEAGYVKVLPNLELEVYAGDWDTLAAQKRR